MLDRSRLEIKLGKYATAAQSALTDNLLLGRVQSYRRQIGGRMVALDKKQAERKIPKGEFFISRKLDGEFSMLAYDGEEIILLNPGGTIRAGLPLLDEAAAILEKAGIKQALIPGELHVAKPDGERARVHDTSRFARGPENEEQLNALHFAVFDLLEVDGSDAGGSFVETWKQITDLFGKGERIAPVETVEGKGAKAVLEKFEEWVEGEGAEGVVARSDTAGWFKVKPRHTLDVAVIGFAEGTDDRAGMLHDMLLGIYRTDGTVQVLGRVGGGFSDDQRRDLLSDLRDLVTESEYAEVNSDRVAYEMIRPELVAEISCLDLISQTTRGGTIDRMVLEWEDDNRIWKTARRLPLCSVISPQFIRIRDDKEPNPEDCRFSQLTDIVEIPLADATSSDLQLPRSEIIKREVRVKELKGKTMVRKLIVWKTNKEEASRGEYPQFVCHLTDFSPNRKDPIKREIRVSDSFPQIQELAEKLETKYFVGGWKEPEAE
ncbi:MAG: hypothetical protein HKN23_15825 [Verrucomicrobiales bacterium]|nr:hypothetical protein [Verrucomicrobiales bacterium]